MLNHEANHPTPLLRLPRFIAGEWHCLDCRHLSYGQSDEPRCPNCLGRRLVRTVEQPVNPVRPRQGTP